MSWLVFGLLWTFAIMIAVSVVVLATPIRFRIEFRSSPQWRLLVSVRLLGGITPAIPIHDSDREVPKKKAPEPKKKPAGRASRRAGAYGLRMIVAAPRLLSGLLRPIRINRLTVDADIGLGDPADTGQVAGLLAAVTYSRTPASALSINIRPDFTGLRFSGLLSGEVQFIPLAFIPPIAHFAWRVFGPRS